ncbi:PucR family transcriptional regulator [Streptomyces griseocarneus]|nr:PucR family transcriptional regulator [Streptomyces griseocarneus]
MTHVPDEPPARPARAARPVRVLLPEAGAEADTRDESMVRDGHHDSGSSAGPGQGRAALLTELLAHARPGRGGYERAAERLTHWLGLVLGGSARLVTAESATGAEQTGAEQSGTSGTEPTADEQSAEVAGVGELLRDVATGRLASASAADRGRHLRLVAVGRRRPGPVLVVTRERPFDDGAAELVGEAAGMLELLVRAGEAEADRRGLEAAVSCLRLAVFQLLMGGDVTLAQRTVAGLSPGLLDTERVDVVVLECPEAERDTVAERCAALTDGLALVVRCPAYDHHVIVVVPLPRGRAADRAGRALRELVAGRPGVFLGRGGGRPLAQTAVAYEDALRALAVARLRPGRTARHAAETRLTQLLDPAGTTAWAGGLLQPLDAVPYPDRGPLLATTGLGLAFTAVKAASILGVSRNTVRARMDRAARLLGTDLTDLTVRAALHLALDADATFPVPVPPVPGQEPPSLHGLLATDTVRAWAHELLGRLSADDRDLRGTLRAWVAAGTGADRAARLLGLHAQTVREHLRAAEALLRRQLLSGGGDLYEVVLAFVALGETDPPVLRQSTDSPGQGSGPRRQSADSRSSSASHRAPVTVRGPGTVHR